MSNVMLNNDTMEYLDDRRQCREKLHVFFGSRDNIYHPLREIVANGIDEISSNFQDGKIIVKLHDDLSTFTISDTGRGLPILGEVNGRPNYKGLFEVLFSGTKYNVTGKTETGTNGVGLTVINNTSLFLDAKICTGGHEYTISYVDGVSEKGLVKGKATKEHGTTLTFKQDPVIYTKTTFSIEEIKSIVHMYAAISNKVVFEVHFKDEIFTYHYNKFQDYFEELKGLNATSKDVILEDIVYKTDMVSPKGESFVQEDRISLYVCTSSEPEGKTWLNNTYLIENGTIYEGVIVGARTYFNNYFKEKKIFTKPNQKLTDDDIINSLTFCCGLWSNNPEFSNQTKFSTGNKTYQTVTKSHIMEALLIAETETPKRIEAMAKHIKQVHSSNTAIEKKRKELKKALAQKAVGTLARPKKLHDCKYKGKGTILYIGEGDSALGGLLKARDSNYQAVTCVRGKILNAAKQPIEKILENDTLKNFITILGCGIDIKEKKFKDVSNFDINNLNYEYIVICTDADPDGFQIRELITVFFYKYMPEIIKQGRLFFAQTPLYEVKYGDDEMLYIYSEEEKESKLKTIEGKYTLARLKGLGELNPDTLYETAMNPETRTWIQVKLDDIDGAEDMISIWMDKDTARRKEVIKQYMKEVSMED